MNRYEAVIDELRHYSEWGGVIPTSFYQNVANVMEQLVKERDAAIADLHESDSCYYCKYSELSWNEGHCRFCTGDEGENKWEWRGLQDDTK